jgi:hypothetical protein
MKSKEIPKAISASISILICKIERKTGENGPDLPVDIPFSGKTSV